MEKAAEAAFFNAARDGDARVLRYCYARGHKFMFTRAIYRSLLISNAMIINLTSFARGGVTALWKFFALVAGAILSLVCFKLPVRGSIKRAEINYRC